MPINLFVKTAYLRDKQNFPYYKNMYTNSELFFNHFSINKNFNCGTSCIFSAHTSVCANLGNIFQVQLLLWTCQYIKKQPLHFLGYIYVSAPEDTTSHHSAPNCNIVWMYECISYCSYLYMYLYKNLKYKCAFGYLYLTIL